MKFIVIDKTQVAGLEGLKQAWVAQSFYNSWDEFVRINNVDFSPTPIANNLSILPLSLTTSPEFADVYAFIMANKTTDFVTREVTQTELDG